VVQQPGANDCKSVSNAVVTALESVGIDATVVEGQFQTGGSIYTDTPHAWVRVDGSEHPLEHQNQLIVDPTAEQFSAPEKTNPIEIITSEDELWDRYRGV
jgi:hypothetical protein